PGRGRGLRGAEGAMAAREVVAVRVAVARELVAARVRVADAREVLGALEVGADHEEGRADPRLVEEVEVAGERFVVDGVPRAPRRQGEAVDGRVAGDLVEIDAEARESFARGRVHPWPLMRIATKSFARLRSTLGTRRARPIVGGRSSSTRTGISRMGTPARSARMTSSEAKMSLSTRQASTMGRSASRSKALSPCVSVPLKPSVTRRRPLRTIVPARRISGRSSLAPAIALEPTTSEASPDSRIWSARRWKSASQRSISSQIT